MEGEIPGCTAVTAAGAPCHMRPMRGGEHCFAHAPDPDQRQTAAAARRLGGLRRRRERAVVLEYDIDGLNTLPGIERLLNIASTDALQLENSVGRNRLLVQIASVALKLFVLEELEGRLSRVEAVQLARQQQDNLSPREQRTGT